MRWRRWLDSTRFWRSPALSISWFGRAASTSRFLLPAVLDDAAALALMPPPLRERLRLGWDAALARALRLERVAERWS